jgi:hypothetical protein
MIDLDALRRLIDETPAGERAAVVRRGFLEQVEREIREGRAAAAQLEADRRIAAVTRSIASGIAA